MTNATQAPAAQPEPQAQPMIATITSRNITPNTGQLRYELNLNGSVYVAFVTPAQLDTLIKMGEHAPKVGEKVQITPGDVLGRDGTQYCSISL